MAWGIFLMACSSSPETGAADATPNRDADLEASVDAGLDATPCNPTRGGPGCAVGEVCCFSVVTMAASCQAGPCPDVPTLGMPAQVCGVSVDCYTVGDTCGPLGASPGDLFEFCRAPGDSSSIVDAGGGESGTAASGGIGADSGNSDAPNRD
jgi:hypothetical protein